MSWILNLLVSASTLLPTATAQPSRTATRSALTVQRTASASATRTPTPAPPKLGGTGTLPRYGGGAASTGLMLDQADFRYPAYIEQIVRTISWNWFKPVKATKTKPAVHFFIRRDGTIEDVRVVVSSGLQYVDRAAMRAVLVSSPLPPLPNDYSGDRLGLQVVFE